MAFDSPLKLVLQGRANVAIDCNNLLVIQLPSIAQTIRAVHSVQPRTGGKSASVESGDLGRIQRSSTGIRRVRGWRDGSADSIRYQIDQGICDP